MQPTSIISEHSDDLESVISQQFAGPFTRIFPSYQGHDTFSAIMYGRWYIISVLQYNFSDVTAEQKEDYRSFVRDCINARWRLLIISREGHSAHSQFIRELFPNKIQYVSCKTIDDTYPAEQIARHVSRFLYQEDKKGLPSQTMQADIRCIRLTCPNCGEEVAVPADIIFYDNDNVKKPIGLLTIRNCTENMLASIRMIAPHVHGAKLAPLVFNNLPTPQFQFVCFTCLEHIETPLDEVQPTIAFTQHLFLNYDDLCRINTTVYR